MRTIFLLAPLQGCKNERGEEGSELCASSSDIQKWYNSSLALSPSHVARAASSGSAALLADPEREPFQYEIQQQVLHCLMTGVQSTTEEKTQGQPPHTEGHTNLSLNCSSGKNRAHVLDR